MACNILYDVCTLETMSLIDDDLWFYETAIKGLDSRFLIPFKEINLNLQCLKEYNYCDTIKRINDCLTADNGVIISFDYKEVKSMSNLEALVGNIEFLGKHVFEYYCIELVTTTGIRNSCEICAIAKLSVINILSIPNLNITKRIGFKTKYNENVVQAQPSKNCLKRLILKDDLLNSTNFENVNINTILESIQEAFDKGNCFLNFQRETDTRYSLMKLNAFIMKLSVHDICFGSSDVDRQYLGEISIGSWFQNKFIDPVAKIINMLVFQKANLLVVNLQKLEKLPIFKPFHKSPKVISNEYSLTKTEEFDVFPSLVISKTLSSFEERLNLSAEVSIGVLLDGFNVCIFIIQWDSPEFDNYLKDPSNSRFPIEYYLTDITSSDPTFKSVLLGILYSEAKLSPENVKLKNENLCLLKHCLLKSSGEFVEALKVWCGANYQESINFDSYSIDQSQLNDLTIENVHNELEPQVLKLTKKLINQLFDLNLNGGANQRVLMLIFDPVRFSISNFREDQTMEIKDCIGDFKNMFNNQLKALQTIDQFNKLNKSQINKFNVIKSGNLKLEIDETYFFCANFIVMDIIDNKPSSRSEFNAGKVQWKNLHNAGINLYDFEMDHMFYKDNKFYFNNFWSVDDDQLRIKRDFEKFVDEHYFETDEKHKSRD
ncbi:hypothetical protein BN7_1867 [Wickerhamomyces ciferrii]|uniref:Uncharacterized protein n=1 Tax=Wickerhamomyces ciferrii (strain ATCC 14091 / BCRC 22168 / CBS 111 / JCM 3599 / NBRC 0793 / NRRL Y-1031 F-60-10) TaxID=1206466 RepID=K0KMJ4_WICCF|nr:uncharacterized protein BN7_1867 [Wickerhamomyces ciferrii]CCH42323.1 hypothetical protein BN7_1867 [Wickerhamomyces ciferrii]